MKSVLALLSLVAFCQCGPLISTERIVNGEEAHYAEFPFQISITVKDFGHNCGGSIINKHYVLTAAHCVVGYDPNDMKIIAGTLQWEEPGSTHEIDKIIVHQEYNPYPSFMNDIALIKVIEPFVISETTGFATLIERNAHVDAGSIAVTSGWGALWEGGPPTKKLMRVNINIFDQEKCNNTNSEHGKLVYNSQICTFNEDMEIGACRGDSGGPLIVDGKVVGIDSWVILCAKTPTVFTRVSSFIDWIESHMD